MTRSMQGECGFAVAWWVKEAGISSVSQILITRKRRELQLSQQDDPQCDCMTVDFSVVPMIVDKVTPLTRTEK